MTGIFTIHVKNL